MMIHLNPFMWKVILLSIIMQEQSVFSLFLSTNSSDSISIRINGLLIPVWSALETWKKCHLIDIPDIPSRAFLVNEGSSNNSDSRTTIRMMNGAVGYHEMHGPTLLNQTRSCDIAWNATLDPNPSMFAGNEFLDSTVRFDNGTVVALIHTEFPGNVYNACNTSHFNVASRIGSTNHHTKQKTRGEPHPPLSYPTCWTVTIGLAISNDFGLTWKHIAKPPHHLVASVPYRYDENQLAYGWGDPSNIVRSPYHSSCGDRVGKTGVRKNGSRGQMDEEGDECFYFVAMWNRNRVEEQPPGICIARTKYLLDPTSWRGWNGTHYSVRFVDPYVQSKEGFDPRDHICEPINLPGLPSVEECNISGLVWSEYLRQFVATIGCFSGHSFFFSVSADLNHWSRAKEFYSRDKDLPPDVASKTTRFLYPTLLDPIGGPNFDKIGKNPYLFWSSIGHSPYKDGRFLWATPLEFDVNNEQLDQKNM